MARSIKSRRLIVLGLVGIITTLLLAFPATSSALPDYTTKTGQACTVCHVNPTGVGALTARGQAFAAIPNHTADPAAAFAASAAAPAATPTRAPAAATPAATPATGPVATPTVAGVTALPRTGGDPLLSLPAALLSALALGFGIYLRRR